MSYSAKHFSLSLPKGEGQDDVSALLRHLAKNLDEMKGIEILDIVFHGKTDGEGEDWPTFTVYYDGEL
jgi:hypothetical protein